MVVINAETVEADKIKEVVAKDEAAATEEAARVQAIADECDADVAAEPLVERRRRRARFRKSAATTSPR